MSTAYPLLAPPFAPSKALRSSADRALPIYFRFQDQLYNTRENLGSFLDKDLFTPKIGAVLDYLWLAGLPRPARPLHHQQLLQRIIHPTENPDNHLVWHEAGLFVKPIPEYLLDYEFWERNLCHSADLHRSACGLLLSYAWLISSKLDLRVAHDTGLLPTDIDFEMWTAFITDFTSRLDLRTMHQVDPRYGYGELRLTRLNTLYCLGAAGFSFHKLVYGYLSMSTQYRDFFQRNFGWIVAAFVYMSVVLSAMQVALATERFQHDARFQGFSYGVALVSIGFVLAAILSMLMICWSLFWFHLLSTRRYCDNVAAMRKRE
ncbi:hypothetical protein CEP54_013790 [Fusarium duplospermum]|uniref:Uncharacterized protein n=1 Tax=Fusarium duplospermum TaxID=1325734 RepID=A0A428P0G8_9HYPO|nr:hypothetical protein CEP54_013790 [Fusarium duplospermum]